MGLTALDAFIVLVLGAVLLPLSIVALGLVAIVRGSRRLRATALRRMRRGGRPARMSAAGSAPFVAVASTTIASPRWWLAQHERQRMWRAVGAAEHAVDVARGAGAPVGDLAALTRQLSGAAHDVDASLRAGARLGWTSTDVRSDRDRIMSCAQGIQRAAMESLSAVSRLASESVAESVDREVAAVAEGVRVVRQAEGAPLA
jgi:hypothetical protein